MHIQKSQLKSLDVFKIYMRVFLTVLILIFSLQSWTKADDIRDFEIEGISIGESLLKYFDEETCVFKS